MKFSRLSKIFIILAIGVFFSSLSLAEMIAYFPRQDSKKSNGQTKESNLEENLYNLSSLNPSISAVSANGERLYQIDRKMSRLKVTDYSQDKKGKESAVQLSRLPVSVAAHPILPIAYLLTAPKGSETQGALCIVGLQDKEYKMIGDPLLIGKSPTSIAISPDGRKVYVTHANGNQSLKSQGALFVFDVASNPYKLSLVSASEIPNRPTGVAVAPNGRAIYLIQQGEESGTLSAIEMNPFRIISQVEIGDDPYALSVSPDGNFVYVAHSEKQQLAVVDVSSYPIQKVLDISLGNSPIVFGKFTDVVSSPMR